MRWITVILVVVLAGLSQAAAAQSLTDEVVLSNDGVFLQRVRQSIITQSINIASDGLNTGINLKRHAQVQAILTGPDSWKSQFADAIASQSSVINSATVNGTVQLKPMICLGSPPPVGCVETGNAVTQGALVSDTVINAAVSAVFNSFFGGQ